MKMIRGPRKQNISMQCEKRIFFLQWAQWRGEAGNALGHALSVSLALEREPLDGAAIHLNTVVRP